MRCVLTDRDVRRERKLCELICEGDRRRLLDVHLSGMEATYENAAFAVVDAGRNTVRRCS
jgi:hypothetical protein